MVIEETFPTALVWAPTSIPHEANWDFGADLGDGKIFIMEDKSTELVHPGMANAYATITIDLVQLRRYLTEIQPAHGVPVFYVLPDTPWLELPHPPVLPIQAPYRFDFEDWAYVISASDLDEYLNAPKDQATKTFHADELPIDGAISLQDFLQRVDDCTLGAVFKDGHPVDEAVEPSPSQGTLGRGGGTSTAHTLVVFIPAASLTGWNRPAS